MNCATHLKVQLTLNFYLAEQRLLKIIVLITYAKKFCLQYFSLIFFMVRENFKSLWSLGSPLYKKENGS